jgi:hypothetical protein
MTICTRERHGMGRHDIAKAYHAYYSTVVFISLIQQLVYHNLHQERHGMGRYGIAKAYHAYYSTVVIIS